MPEIIIQAGDKVELEKGRNPDSLMIEPTILLSQVMEPPEGNTLKLSMPTEKTHTILLRVEEEYELHFYTSSGTFSCTGKVIDGYKEDAFSIAVVELITSLEKLQRRQFFRADCVRPLRFYALSEEELSELKYYGESSGSMETGWTLAGLGTQTERCDEGVLTDISGGGMRFTTHSELSKGGVLYVSMELEQRQGVKVKRMFAKIISSVEMEKKPGTYENRLEFLWLSSAEREEIIRFVFDEDRKRLKRERGSL